MSSATAHRGSHGIVRGHAAYPVKTVARLTGLSADIIRAWERRYGVVAPVRGPRGARLYSADDVAHLQLLSRAVAAGRAIGDVAVLDRSTLSALVDDARPPAPERATPPGVDRFVDDLRQCDAAALDQHLGEALVALGPREFVRQVAAPLLVVVGERWEAGALSIAEEHLLSATLRGLLSSLMRVVNRGRGPLVVLATPSGERHEMGLLLVGLLTLDSGMRVHYLGTDLPASEVVDAARRSGAAVVGLSLVDGANAEHAAAQVTEIERGLPAGTELWLGGGIAATVRARLGATRALAVGDMDSLEHELGRLWDRSRP